MKANTLVLVVLALGVAAWAGCGGSSGDNVPTSSAAYMGSSLPAVLDSTTNTQSLGVNFLSDIGQMTGPYGGGAVPRSLGSTSSATSDSGQGGDGGSYTYSASSSSTWDETSLRSSSVQSLSFNDFADSSGVFIAYGLDARADLAGLAVSPLAMSPGSFYYAELQAGRGSRYWSTSYNVTTDGNPDTVSTSQPLLIRVGPGPLGLRLTSGSAFHANFASFFTSQGHTFDGNSAQQTQLLQSGFVSGDMSAALDTTIGQWSFDDTLSADYAMDYFYSYSDDVPSQQSTHYTRALMNFNQNHAWDLSTATFISSGTFCAEGDMVINVSGCLDFDVSLTWEKDALDELNFCRGDNNLILCYGQPDDGQITLAAGGASTAFAFTPGGGTFTFDAGNGSDPFQTNFSPIGAD